MEVPYEFEKQCKEEFGDECYFQWNEHKNIFQAIAHDTASKEKYVIFYVSAKEGAWQYRPINQSDIQRIRDARSFNDVEKKRKVQDMVAHSRAMKARQYANRSKKPSSVVEELANDMNHENFSRAIARDYSRNLGSKKRKSGGRIQIYSSLKDAGL